MLYNCKPLFDRIKAELKKVVVGGWTTFRGFGAVYFDTEAHCKQVIDEFWDELLWYFTEFKDRADM